LNLSNVFKVFFNIINMRKEGIVVVCLFLVVVLGMGIVSAGLFDYKRFKEQPGITGEAVITGYAACTQDQIDIGDTSGCLDVDAPIEDEWEVPTTCSACLQYAVDHSGYAWYSSSSSPTDGICTNNPMVGGSNSYTSGCPNVDYENVVNYQPGERLEGGECGSWWESLFPGIARCYFGLECDDGICVREEDTSNTPCESAGISRAIGYSSGKRYYVSISTGCWQEESGNFPTTKSERDDYCEDTYEEGYISGVSGTTTKTVSTLRGTETLTLNYYRCIKEVTLTDCERSANQCDDCNDCLSAEHKWCESMSDVSVGECISSSFECSYPDFIEAGGCSSNPSTGGTPEIIHTSTLPANCEDCINNWHYWNPSGEGSCTDDFSTGYYSSVSQCSGYIPKICANYASECNTCEACVNEGYYWSSNLNDCSSGFLTGSYSSVSQCSGSTPTQTQTQTPTTTCSLGACDISLDCGEGWIAGTETCERDVLMQQRQTYSCSENCCQKSRIVTDEKEICSYYGAKCTEISGRVAECISDTFNAQTDCGLNSCADLGYVGTLRWDNPSVGCSYGGCYECINNGNCPDTLICENHKCIVESQTTTNTGIPSSWSCVQSYYGDGQCDCGCGAEDIDCSTRGCITTGCYNSECEFCFAENTGRSIGCPGTTTGTSTGGDLGDSCTNDWDCKGILVCPNNICANPVGCDPGYHKSGNSCIVDTPTGGDLGDSCTNDWDCKGILVCPNNICANPVDPMPCYLLENNDCTPASSVALCAQTNAYSSLELCEASIGSCGNNGLDEGEVCDGKLTAELVTCETLGFGPGTLTCKDDCSGYDTNGCSLECDDTDDGINVTNKAKVNFNGNEYYDECSEEGFVLEQFCINVLTVNNNREEINVFGKAEKAFFCPRGLECFEGACVDKSIIPWRPECIDESECTEADETCVEGKCEKVIEVATKNYCENNVCFFDKSFDNGVKFEYGNAEYYITYFNSTSQGVYLRIGEVKDREGQQLGARIEAKELKRVGTINHIMGLAIDVLESSNTAAKIKIVQFSCKKEESCLGNFECSALDVCATPGDMCIIDDYCNQGEECNAGICIGDEDEDSTTPQTTSTGEGTGDGTTATVQNVPGICRLQNGETVECHYQNIEYTVKRELGCNFVITAPSVSEVSFNLAALQRKALENGVSVKRDVNRCSSQYLALRFESGTTTGTSITNECQSNDDCSGSKVCIEGDCITPTQATELDDLFCVYGCFEENKCYPVGYRKGDEYCGIDNSFLKQRDSERTPAPECDNSFECSSNLCLEGECVSSGFLKKIGDFFKGLFG
jgi:hypothetical protein